MPPFDVFAVSKIHPARRVHADHDDGSAGGQIFAGDVKRAQCLVKRREIQRQKYQLRPICDAGIRFPIICRNQAHPEKRKAFLHPLRVLQ